MSSIIINCPNCSRQNSIDSQHIGKHAKCGACKSVFLVSDGTQPVGGAVGSAAVTSSGTPYNESAPINYSTVPPAGTAIGQDSPSPQFLQNLSTVGQTGFRCPFCQSNAGLYTRDQISTAGWVVFAVLLMSCAPLCWIGLLIKEPTNHCGNCHLRIG